MAFDDFDAHHLDHDFAMYAAAATMTLPGAELFTRWLSHRCAPSFVFLTDTSLALASSGGAVKV